MPLARILQPALDPPVELQETIFWELVQQPTHHAQHGDGVVGRDLEIERGRILNHPQVLVHHTQLVINPVMDKPQRCLVELGYQLA